MRNDYIFNSKQLIQLLGCLLVAFVIGSFAPPEGVADRGMWLLGAFIATILGLIIKPLPMGAVALLGMMGVIVSKTLPLAVVFQGFAQPVVWLVVFALFIAQGFAITGLGQRIAYEFMRLFGKKSIGLGYGLMITDLMMAPAIPSVTGRVAGIIFPIMQGISSSYDSEPNNESSERIGRYLILCVFQVAVVTSAMFMTAMAANPLIATLAGKQNIEISWLLWAKAAFVPGIITLGLIPFLMYRLSPPGIKDTPEAPKQAKAALEKMGPMSRAEWIMLGTVLVLLCLWVGGRELGVHAVTAAMIGLSILLVTQVLKWNELVKLSSSWETFFWFAVLIAMAGQLNEMGLVHWFSVMVSGKLTHIHWQLAFPCLALVYFYSHYFFASSTAHVASMFLPFLGIALAMDTPPMLATLTLVYFSNLFGGLTHYSTAPAPLLFGAGYVDIKEWWRIGFIFSLVYLIIWSVIGSAWWKLLGLW